MRTILVAALAVCVEFTQGGIIQKPGLEQSAEAATRAAAVKDAFRHAYADYMRYGYPADEVAPLTRGKRNTRNGWGATLFDSLSTLLVMDLKTEFDDAVAKAAKVDFSRSYVPTQNVSVFETTIRYLGGMLSAYELTNQTNKALIDRAKQLGDKLTHAWESPKQKIPYGYLNFTSDKAMHRISNVAEAGTLTLEFDRLSKYTGDVKYRNLALRAAETILRGPHVFLGLPGQGINPADALPAGGAAHYVTWGGGTDSLLEYALKFALLTDNRESIYLTTWQKAVKSSFEHLLTKSSVKNLTYLADYSSSHGGKQHVFSHLACSVGANWLVGAKVLDDARIYQTALELVDTCMNSYNGTATGIGAEWFAFLGPEGETTGSNPSESDLAFYREHGFFILNGFYVLRPEVIESVFTAYRITGDQKYQDFAWTFFNNLNRHCKGLAGYALLEDVNNPNTALVDQTESFLYAEVFKYLYLTFAPPSVISLDEYVLNTECHPFKIQPLTQPWKLAASPTKPSSARMS